MTTYNKTNWTTEVPLNPGNLQKIEDGIESAHSELTTHENDATKHKTSLAIRTETTTEFRVEVRTSDPANPEVGRVWLRSDL